MNGAGVTDLHPNPFDWYKAARETWDTSQNVMCPRTVSPAGGVDSTGWRR